MGITIVDNRGKSRAASLRKSLLQVCKVFNVVDTANFVITFNNCQVMVTGLYYLKHLLHSLAELRIPDTAANIQGNGNGSFFITQFTTKIQTFRLPTIAPRRRFLIIGRYGAHHFF